MKRIRPFFLFIVLLTLVSCKKDKLEGDSSILVGTWSWTETYTVSNHCDAEMSWNYVLTDSSETGSTYAVLFVENGKVEFYHNGGKINTNRIVFNDAGKETFTSGPYDYKFEIFTNNNSDDTMRVWVGQDSLLINDFPKDTDASCEEQFNHFVKQ